MFASGVGGFFDSFLVMIIVTVGLMLVTSTLYFTNGEMSDLNRSESLEYASQDLLDQIASDGSLFVEDGLIDFIAIKGASNLSLSVGNSARGYMIILIEVHPVSTPLTLVENGTIPSDLEGLHTAKMPVNVQHSESDIRAAIISAWVW